VPIAEEVKNKIGTKGYTEKPENATEWSTLSRAKEFGIGHDEVNLILREWDITPHLVKEFSFSRESDIEEELTGVVGLYLNPPDKAMVLCVDEKSQIPALERRAPLLRLVPHVPERQTVDYERHGTTPLFAALDMRPGMVSGKVRIIIAQKNTLLS
jgi:hypothetical protein